MASVLKGQSGQPIQFETVPNVNGDDVLTRPEIVGTVAQSGGVPTGAIIQRGSNANGEFVRYADGTQICWCDVTEYTTNAGALIVRNYPASFTSNPRSAGCLGWCIGDNNGPDNQYFGFLRPGNLDALATWSMNIHRISTGVRMSNITHENATIRIMFIGRWY